MRDTLCRCHSINGLLGLLLAVGVLGSGGRLVIGSIAILHIRSLVLVSGIRVVLATRLVGIIVVVVAASLLLAVDKAELETSFYCMWGL